MYGNADGDWVGCIAGQDTMNGNLWADPLFCEPDSGDYRIEEDSPCAPPNNSCGVLIGAEPAGCSPTSAANIGGAMLAAPLLRPAVPNPFNSATVISFDLPKAGRVSVRVFNARGQLVRTLVDEEKAAGHHRVQWNGLDSGGDLVSAGVYFCKFEADGNVTTGKLVLLE